MYKYIIYTLNGDEITFTSNKSELSICEIKQKISENSQYNKDYIHIWTGMNKNPEINDNIVKYTDQNIYLDVRENMIFKTKDQIKETIQIQLKNSDSQIIKTYGNINDWDTSIITDISCLFQDLPMNIPEISNWNVSNVKDMSYLFANAIKFNEPLNWDVSNVENMYCMFANADSFNQPLIWDVSNVENMGCMFTRAKKFNQQLNWNIGSVTNMNAMFMDAKSFNTSLDWTINMNTNIQNIFAGSKLEDNNNLPDWVHN